MQDNKTVLFHRKHKKYERKYLELSRGKRSGFERLTLLVRNHYDDEPTLSNLSPSTAIALAEALLEGAEDLKQATLTELLTGDHLNESLNENK